MKSHQVQLCDEKLVSPWFSPTLQALSPCTNQSPRPTEPRHEGRSQSSHASGGVERRRGSKMAAGCESLADVFTRRRAARKSSERCERVSGVRASGSTSPPRDSQGPVCGRNASETRL
ncbi:unnamed protein product [Pleuronectes platessa]|uniref:Uncharacterized protein n=1 Tax=Pleuronectes platessa TaxID=8262 RepID=A0A9N7TPR0_PLEPL|nr:unnamed protein product [Pleuronectes platessa]